MTRRYVKERKVPSRRDLVASLVDKWKFLDIIGFHGGCQAFGEIHKELLEWYDDNDRDYRRDLILMPRGHLKTTIITVLDILHSMYVNPNIRIFVGSSNGALAQAIMREVVANLNNPWLQEHVWNNRPHISGRLIPLMDKLASKRRQVRRNTNNSFDEWDDSLLDDIGDEDTPEMEQEANKKIIWTQKAIQVLRQYDLKEPTLVAGSVESPNTGFHYDKLYFDDIINFENYDKPIKVERLDTWRHDMMAVLDPYYFDEDLYDWLCSTSRSQNYRNVFKKMCQVGDSISVVGTRYFKHDWYKKILDDDESEYRKWEKNIYVNFEDNSDGYIWYERWSEKEDKKRRKEMSKKHFYAQYLNKVIVTEDQILPFDQVQFIHPSQVRQKDGIRVWVTFKGEDNIEMTKEVVLHCVVDPAATCNKDSDFTACAIGGKDEDGNLYVFDVRLWKLPTDKWIRELYKLLGKWNLRAIHLETVAFFVTMKDSIKKYFKEFYPISIRDYKPSNKSSKKERIETGLEPLMTNGMLYMSTYLKSNNELVDQFNFFPAETVHDDGVDAVEMLNEVSRKTVPLKKANTRKSYVQYNTKYGGFH